MYRLSAANCSRESAAKLSLIDALPYKGDHAIVEDGRGSYVDRGSKFVTGLTKSLESVNPAEVNDLFSFFYQMTPQGADPSSMRDGSWVTAGKVTDFSAVTSVKAVLKDGKSIAGNATVTNLHTPKPDAVKKAGKGSRRLPWTGDAAGAALVAAVGALGLIALAGGVRRRRQNG